MLIQLRPAESDLAKLKVPLGILLEGGANETMPRLLRMVKESHPRLVVAVGDVVSRETLTARVPVDVRIVDQKTLRSSVGPTEYPAKRLFHVRNPAGVITMAAWDVLRSALRAGDSVVFVEGEEDLLALPCVIESPVDSFVLYGQPKEGLVVVVSSQEKKHEVGELLSRMQREEVLE